MHPENRPKGKGKVARNNWPYLLRILLKAGWTPEGLSHAAMISEDRLRDYMAGRRIPEHSTARVLAQIISRHKRQDGLRIRTTQDIVPLVPVNEIPEGVPTPLARGVYEDASPPAGYRQFRAIADDGTELVSLRLHWRAEERDLVPGLRAWLNRSDPIIRLLETDASEQTS